MRTFNLPKVRITSYDNGFPKGFVLKREVTTKEAMHILNDILGIDTKAYKAECDDKEDWKKFVEDVTENINKWLIGDVDDSYILSEYVIETADEPFGVILCVPLLYYLDKIKVL